MSHDPADLPPPPPWLSPLQDAFARVIQTPLDPHTGTLRSTVEAPEPAAQLSDAHDGRARLALYHEQYWMRLFNAMQGEFPRFARVAGYWRFNALATIHLRETPPVSADLARCADGFAARLIGLLDRIAARAGNLPPSPDTRPLRSLIGPPADAWEAALAGAALAGADTPLDLARQALRADEAVRHAFVSPFQGIWRPSAPELEGLEGRRLRFSASFRLLREDWALTEDVAPSADPPDAFSRRPQPLFFVSFRAPRTTALRRIEPPFARFLNMAIRSPFGEALAAVAERCDGPQAGRLRAAVPGWVKLALASGWWIGTHR